MFKQCLLSLMILVVLITSSQAEDVHQEHHHKSTHSSKISAGEPEHAKFAADQHTKDTVAEMSKAIAEFQKAAEAKKLAAYNALGNDLDKKLGELIKGCTMQGEDHDKLHAWLEEFKPGVDSLVNAKELAAAEKAETAVQKSLKTFSLVFH
jgi:hypothetical protein